MKRGGPLKRRAQMKRRRDTPRRRDDNFVASAEYRQWVGTLPCAICCALADPRDATPVHAGDPHHAGTHGLGQKPSDYTCIPMCRAHHDALHGGKLTPINQTVQAWEERVIRCTLFLWDQWTRKRATGYPLSETARELFFTCWALPEVWAR